MTALPGDVVLPPAAYVEIVPITRPVPRDFVDAALTRWEHGERTAVPMGAAHERDALSRADVLASWIARSFVS